MNKYLFLLTLTVAVLCTACEKNQSGADDDPLSTNPYPYLRVSDLSPIYKSTVSNAESHISRLGFTGGWGRYWVYDDHAGRQIEQECYLYFNETKTDTIGIEENNGVTCSVYYISGKSVNPEDAKEWIKHPGASFHISSWQNTLNIRDAKHYHQSGGEAAWERGLYLDNYSAFLLSLDSLSTDSDISCCWSDVEDLHDSGCSVELTYRHVNNSHATLGISDN